MRKARVNIPGVIYHVISRFVNRAWLFETHHDRRRYLQFLEEALKQSDWSCFAYALMSSHIHLAFVAGRMALESWAKPVHTSFAQWMNTRDHRLGPVFANRPDDFAVPAHRELDLVAYIHNNPVRAGVVSHAAESSWTSHGAFTGAAPRPAWLHVDASLARIGLDAASFDRAVTTGDVGKTEAELGELRRALRGRGAINVGTPTVGERVVVPLVARPFAVVRPDPRLLVRAVSSVVSVDIAAMTSRQRAPRVSAARRIAIHCGRQLGLYGSDVAAVLGISRQRASAVGAEDLDGEERAACALVLERLRVEQA